MNSIQFNNWMEFLYVSTEKMTETKEVLVIKNLRKETVIVFYDYIKS